MAVLPKLDAGSYDPRTAQGGGPMHPWRKGPFKATGRGEVAPVKGREQQLNLITTSTLHVTVPDDEGKVCEGVEIRNWTPIFGEYSPKSKRAGKPKILEVVDWLVACGVTPTKAVAAVNKACANIDTDSAEDVQTLTKKLNALLGNAKLGEEHCLVVMGLENQPYKGIYNCATMTVAMSELEKRVEAGKVVDPWSPAETKQIERSGRRARDDAETAAAAPSEDEDDIDETPTETAANGADLGEADPFAADGE